MHGWLNILEWRIEVTPSVHTAFLFNHAKVLHYAQMLQFVTLEALTAQVNILCTRCVIIALLPILINALLIKHSGFTVMF